MRRIQRRARLKPGGLEPGSTRHQLLLYGMVFTNGGPPFESESDKKQAWQAHRSELLAECPPGTRPNAFFLYDLRVDRPPLDWHDQVRLLLDRQLLSIEEAVRCECDYRMLNPTDSLDFCSGFESESDIHRQHLSAQVLARLACQFQLAARWHDWRGRPKIAAKYQLRASVVGAFLQKGEL